MGGREQECDVPLSTFLSVPTAEFVSYLRSPGLSQEDLDEESVFSVRRDHHLLNVRVCGAFVTGEDDNQASAIMS